MSYFVLLFSHLLDFALMLNHRKQNNLKINSKFNFKNEICAKQNKETISYSLINCKILENAFYIAFQNFYDRKF